MAAKSQWMLDIPNIVEQLSTLDTPVVDRRTCERLFGVQRRRAIDLMQRFGGYRSGSSILLDRLGLVRQLQDLAGHPEIERESARKRRLSDHLVKLERHRRAASVRINVGPDATNCMMSDLPVGVSFGSGKLMVEYGGIEDLLAKLYQLAQAAANDFDRFTSTAVSST